MWNALGWLTQSEDSANMNKARLTEKGKAGMIGERLMEYVSSETLRRQLFGYLHQLCANVSLRRDSVRSFSYTTRIFSRTIRWYLAIKDA